MRAPSLPDVIRGLCLLAHAQTGQPLSFLLRGRTLLLSGPASSLVLVKRLHTAPFGSRLRPNNTCDMGGVSRDSSDDPSYGKEGNTEASRSQPLVAHMAITTVSVW